MENHRDAKLWKELDSLAFIASAVAIILLVVIYFFIAGDTKPSLPQNDIVRMFLLDIISSLIPVFLLFAELHSVLISRIQWLCGRT